ncbi:hypothetical protein [Haloechinothrix sp. LS1_15]|uniref:hypothetical protein n=1 Tax=Haloechinothrix sp. LS1_15 TaxID=2652248 RepID=UPI0029456A45|nr:hypothetical protein [Haloechinothrix sp. LS1_15]MDV6014183.1 hypothetical protein [Haloechinothrix sp. LS1_15]
MADRRAFLTDGFAPVNCHSCGTGVLVRKNSEKHTSIQWTSDPAVSCPVYAELVAEGGNTALMDTCARLSDSIAAAVASGEISVGSTEREDGT